MKFSILIPARNEEAFLPTCLASIAEASKNVTGGVQTVVCVNRCTDRTEQIARDFGATIVHDDSKNLSMIRNAAARAATGEILLTIDADSAMSPNMLALIEEKLATGRYVGGGVLILPSRYSLGIVLTGIMLLPLAAWYRVSAGLFWCYKRDFDAIGGFDESYITIEDVDFARRLKAHGKKTGRRFAHLFRAHITTSTRKFDRFGDWYLVKRPLYFWTLLRGRNNQREANQWWYEIER